MMILDSTLREGEQTANVAFSIDDKLTLAKMLDDFGVDMIEAGHPSVSPDVNNFVKQLSNEGLNAEVLAHVRAVRSDINLAIQSGVDRIVVFLPTSDLHLEHKLRISKQNALDIVAKEIEYIKDHGIKVRYTPEDTTRTNLEYLITMCNNAINAGADRISIADTVGVATPWEFESFVKHVTTSINAEVDVHCHNDMGLAIANAIAGVRGGATVVHATVNGLGERCGIVDLALISLLYELKANELFSHIPLRLNKYKIDMLTEISEFVQNASGLLVSANQPIVGEFAFTHKSGVHTDGVLKNPQTYEPYDPILIGRTRNIVIDRYTSKLAVRRRLEDYGITAGENDLIEVINEIKKLGDRQRTIYDSDIVNIYENIKGNQSIILPSEIEALIDVHLVSSMLANNIIRKIQCFKGVRQIFELSRNGDITVMVSVENMKSLNDLIEDIKSLQGISSVDKNIILKKAEVVI
jgi:2-isopropylmalate synthase